MYAIHHISWRNWTHVYCRKMFYLSRRRIDVESLYTNIQHKVGLQAVIYFLYKQLNSNRLHDSLLIDLLDFVLKQNNFVFHRKFYKQTSGTVMGARCAPSYANIFLGWWEELVVNQNPKIQKNLILWNRFINDILFFWRGTLEDCLKFVEDLNNNTLNIHLTTHYSFSSVNFLDLKISLDNKKINTTRKNTVTNSLLLYGSFHPTCLKKGIPTGQFARIKRNCSFEMEFKLQARELTNRFVAREYPHRIISQAFQRAKNKPQSELLHARMKPEDNTLRYITTFNTQWGQLCGILGRNWNILVNDEKIDKQIPQRPQLIARRVA